MQARRGTMVMLRACLTLTLAVLCGANIIWPLAGVGPWNADVRAEVEESLCNDFPPPASPNTFPPPPMPALEPTPEPEPAPAPEPDPAPAPARCLDNDPGCAPNMDGRCDTRKIGTDSRACMACDGFTGEAGDALAPSLWAVRDQRTVCAGRYSCSDGKFELDGRGFARMTDGPLDAPNSWFWNGYAINKTRMGSADHWVKGHGFRRVFMHGVPAGATWTLFARLDNTETSGSYWPSGDFYYAYMMNTGVHHRISLHKRVDGVKTMIGSVVVGPAYFTKPFDILLKCDGTTISVADSRGKVHISVTNSDVRTGRYTGFQLHSEDSRWVHGEAYLGKFCAGPIAPLKGSGADSDPHTNEQCD
jgi:hypothetical protein